MAFILPGDYRSTVSALENMVNMVKDGASPREVVTVFCEDIVSHAAK